MNDAQSTLSEQLRESWIVEQRAAYPDTAKLLEDAAALIDRQHEALKKLRPWAANRRLALIAESATHTHEGESDASGTCGPCLAAEGVE